MQFKPSATSVSLAKMYQDISFDEVEIIIERSGHCLVFPLLDLFLHNSLETILNSILPLLQEKVIDITVSFSFPGKSKEYLSRTMIMNETILGVKLCTQEVEVGKRQFHPWMKERKEDWYVTIAISKIVGTTIQVGDVIFNFTGFRLLAIFDVDFLNFGKFFNQRKEISKHSEKIYHKMKNSKVTTTTRKKQKRRKLKSHLAKRIENKKEKKKQLENPETKRIDNREEII